jgi:D-amino-acid dehydrogenase
MADARDLMRQQGCMYVYQNQREFDDAKLSNQTRRDLGASFTELDSDDIRELEPHLKMEFAKGLLFEKASQVINPQSLCERYFDCFLRHQGKFIRKRAEAIHHGDDAIQVELDDGTLIDARRVVIAAGAFSNQIEGIATRFLPLDTERGYHIQFNGMQQLLNRPVSWNQYGFYATPTDQGLRFAGTVELAGYGPEMNPRNLNLLNRKAQQMFDLPEAFDQQWLGYRPTLPDALPVIGFSVGSEYIMFAFGHHHIGLTLAGITGKLIAELANHEEPSHNITPFSPRRFL